MTLLSLHPNIIVHVENVVSLFSSPSTSSQKVQKCGSHKLLACPNTCEFLTLLLWSCPSLQRCCWNMTLLSLHPNIIVHVENVVSLFSSPSTSSQKVQKCGSHKLLACPNTCEFLTLLLRSCPSLQRCCWNMTLLSLHPNIIVHDVENVVSLFSSPSTSSQKVRKCGGHKLLACPNTCEFLPLLLRSCPSLQRCCWKIMLLSLHPNTIVHVENVVSLFSSPSTSSQKVRKCGGHKLLACPNTCEFLTLLLWSCPSLQRCCWNMTLLSLHPNIIVHVENVVSLFSSPSTSSQKVQKCGSHKLLACPNTCEFLTLLLRSCPSLQRCCWNMTLLSLHPNIIVHDVENVVSLFSSPSTSSQKVRKCGGHKLLACPNTCEFLPLLLRSCPSLQRCCWKMMLLSLHPNTIVHVENVVSLFSSPSTSSQKVRKCGGHKLLACPNTCEFLPLLLRSCPSLQRCCWNMTLLPLHPNIIVHVENVVSLFSSPSTSSQKVRKCGGHACPNTCDHCFSGVAQVCRDAAGI